MRYLSARLTRDLSKKMVLLAGPRQCGKTTLAKSLLDERGQYLSWDITKDRRIIREAAWPKDASLIVLDELHKAPKWKNLLKAVADEFGNKPPVLVTGSARLDALRRTGDALTGRQYFYRLHPIDVAESKLFLPELALEERLRRLLASGGFPEAFLNPEEAARLRNDRMEIVTREDLRDLSRVTSWRGPADLIELLRERVGKPTNYDNLAQSLGISPPTAKSWVELLEKLYVVFLLPSYSTWNARRRSPALRSCHSPSGLRHCRLRVVCDKSGEISAPESVTPNGDRPTALAGTILGRVNPRPRRFPWATSPTSPSAHRR